MIVDVTDVSIVHKVSAAILVLCAFVHKNTQISPPKIEIRVIFQASHSRSRCYQVQKENTRYVLVTVSDRFYGNNAL